MKFGLFCLLPFFTLWQTYRACHPESRIDFFTILLLLAFCMPLASLILYYSLWLLPNQKPFFYVSIYSGLLLVSGLLLHVSRVRGAARRLRVDMSAYPAALTLRKIGLIALTAAFAGGWYFVLFGLPSGTSWIYLILITLVSSQLFKVLPLPEDLRNLKLTSTVYQSLIVALLTYPLYFFDALYFLLIFCSLFFIWWFRQNIMVFLEPVECRRMVTEFRRNLWGKLSVFTVSGAINVGVVLIVSAAYVFLLNFVFRGNPYGTIDVFEYLTAGIGLSKSASFQVYMPLANAELATPINFLHGLSYPLLATWDLIANSNFWGAGELTLFKVASLSSGALLILGIFFHLQGTSRIFILAGVLALLSSEVFARTLVNLEIDGYRLSAMFFGFIYLFRNLESFNRRSALLAGAFLGMAAFCHSITAMLVFSLPVLLLLLLRSPVRERLALVGCFSGSALIFGLGFYVFDTFLGKGWILNAL